MQFISAEITGFAGAYDSGFIDVGIESIAVLIGAGDEQLVAFFSRIDCREGNNTGESRNSYFDPVLVCILDNGGMEIDLASAGVGQGAAENACEGVGGGIRVGEEGGAKSCYEGS